MTARTHGMSRTAIYSVWQGMIARCEDPHHISYPFYGGRGIRVCPEWRADFAVFIRDVGDRPPGMTLDRINSDGNYEPGNVRWANRSEQSKNRRPWVHPSSKKTHCPQNHPYDEANTYIVPKSGYRQCRTCIANRQRQKRETEGKPA